MKRNRNAARPMPLALAALVALIFSASVQAATPPSPGLIDTRLRTVDYNPLDVTEVKAYLGYQIMLQFGEDETIENVALGDAQSWQVTPTKSATLMFLKPVTVPSRTNMTIITNKRGYHFDLIGVDEEPKAPDDLTFTIGFHYPAEEAAKAAIAAAAVLAAAEEQASLTPEPKVHAASPQANLNFDYRYKGAEENLPESIYDDGERTFMRWRSDRPLPAIFLANGKKGKDLVNFSVQGDQLVLDTCAAELELRNGSHNTRLFNMRLYGKKRGHKVPQVGAGHEEEPQ